MKRIILLLMGLGLMMALFGCGSSGSGSLPSTQIVTQASVNGILRSDPFVPLFGIYVGGYYTPWATQFSRSSDVNGIANISGIQVPGEWIVARSPSALCPSGQNFGGYLFTSIALHLQCNSVIVFSVAPESIYAFAAPASMQITGQGIDATYSMPKVRYYDEFGNCFAEYSATSVSGDGTSLTVPVPNLSQLYSGQYAVVVLNAASDGSWYGLGGSIYEIYGNDPPPGPDGKDPGSCVDSNCLINP
jgi:hypothetical protein